MTNSVSRTARVLAPTLFLGGMVVAAGGMGVAVSSDLTSIGVAAFVSGFVICIVGAVIGNRTSPAETIRDSAWPQQPVWNADDGLRTNPATGLPCRGLVDVAGNPYGTRSSSRD